MHAPNGDLFPSLFFFKKKSLNGSSDKMGFSLHVLLSSVRREVWWPR